MIAPDEQLARIRSLSFDCYGTLIDWITGIRGALGELAAGGGALPVDLGEFFDTYLEVEGRIEAEPYMPYQEVLTAAQAELAQRFGLTVPPDRAHLLAASVPGWKPYDDTNARNLFNTDNSWSPDGEWIASSSGFQPSGEELPHPNIIAFFVPDPDSDEEVDAPVRISFSDEHEDGAPSVSPDGQWVAFESHRTEDEQSPSDLWIISLPQDLRP